MEPPVVKVSRRYDGAETHWLNTMGFEKDYVRVDRNALSGVDVWLDSQVSPDAVFYSDSFQRACRAAKLKRMTFLRAAVVEG